MRRLRYMLEVNPRSREEAGLDPAVDVSFAPMEALKDGLGGLGELAIRPAGELKSGSYNFFRNGDVLLAKVTPCFENGKKAIAGGLRNGVGFATSEVHVIRPNPRVIETRFLTYLLSSEDFRAAGMASMTGAGGLRRVSNSAILDYRLGITDVAEQRVIATFLDRETARIDALIAKKERLIERQRERAQSLVWTITTGRDRSDVARTDTDFTWMIAVPAHWRAVRIKRVARLESGHTPSRSKDEYWSNPTIAWVSLADSGQLRQRDVLYETAYKISEEGLANSSARILPSGTVVFTRDATVGLAAVLGIDMAVSQHLAGWLCGPQLRPFYLLYVIRAMEHELNRLTWGATIKTIGMPDLLNLSCPLPPVVEQDAIVARLRAELARADDLKRKVQDSIGLLHQLRTALITAAVTGQLDPATWGRRGNTERAAEAIEVAGEHARIGP